MALDSRQKRAAVIGVGRAWYRNPHPSSMDAAQRASVAQVYPVAAFQGVAAPAFSGTIPNLSYAQDSGTHDTDYSGYFTGATSYSIAPAVETGWTFNTSTGVLTVDAEEVGEFGSYVITGTNAGGSAVSNAFFVEIEKLGGGDSRGRKRRKVYGTEEVYEALRKARERVEEPEKPVSAEEMVKRKIELAEIEQDVRKRLTKKYEDTTAKIAPPEKVEEFVEGLDFDKAMGVVKDEDIIPVLLILLIDEITDE